jgi:hypothetical protein
VTQQATGDFQQEMSRYRRQLWRFAAAVVCLPRARVGAHPKISDLWSEPQARDPPDFLLGISCCLLAITCFFSL